MERAKNNSQLAVLGIESSCDDTSASVYIDGKVCSNVVASQKIHEEFGGVVPEWASRKHQLNIVPTVHSALQKAGVSMADIDGIACTQGPGLMGSLLVGHSFAKGLAVSSNIPYVNVNHLDAHVLAHFIDGDIPPLPFLCLLVSGGHTQIVVVRNHFEIEILGKTIDDAAGEAFDKAGKMLNLPYPAGPIIDQKAMLGDPNAFQFNTPTVDALDFSFSGLKTSILYFLQKEVLKDASFVTNNINDLCASIQHTIVSYLISKMDKAIAETGIIHIGIAGGVAANSELRAAMQTLASKYQGVGYEPKFEYCTDNAAMIAYAGKVKLERKEYGTLNEVCFTRK
ncbi:MAG: tRNA (adenosine(37)-N6)-threonylcarbamoyltransferase complex transferase subunit TsaD [Bacteroidia bacterium]|nr:tRNA (adenosine(37)-N6)-threonylcarbamoyltransferase complex transferase subunit TsaD [Bacteroidia bacterium]